MPSQILVAGGGIGGLSAALACTRGGARVQLHERANAFSEVGAGIQLGPNATRVLKGWDLERALRAAAAAPGRLQIFSARDGGELAAMSLGREIEARYGAPYLTIHRADLQALLLEAVRGAGVVLSLGSTLAALAEDGTGVTARDESQAEVRADALVAADGIWSALRQAVLGDGPAHPTGHVAFRAIAPQSALPAQARSADVNVWLGPRMHVVTYPVRGGEWLNVVALVEAAARLPSQDWDQAGTIAELMAGLGAIAPALLARVEAMPHWRVWTLNGRPPVAGPHQMGKGRVALLGDAAHPMLPYLAQGAGMAIEDAQALAEAFAAETQATAAIHRYAQARWARCAQVQRGAFRNARIFHLQGPLQWGRDFAMRTLGQRLLDQPWLYGR